MLVTQIQTTVLVQIQVLSLIRNHSSSIFNRNSLDYHWRKKRTYRPNTMSSNSKKRNYLYKEYFQCFFHESMGCNATKIVTHVTETESTVEYKGTHICSSKKQDIATTSCYRKTNRVRPDVKQTITNLHDAGVSTTQIVCFFSLIDDLTKLSS